MKKLRLNETIRGHLASRWRGQHLNHGHVASKPTLCISTHTFLLSPLQDLGRPIQFIIWWNWVCWVEKGILVLLNTRLWNLIWITWDAALWAAEDTALSAQAQQLVTELGVKPKSLPQSLHTSASHCRVPLGCLRPHFLRASGGKRRCFPLWFSLVPWSLHH